MKKETKMRQGIDWLTVSLNLMECFLAMEGTYLDGEWSEFGITEEQSKILKEEHKKKFCE